MTFTLSFPLSFAPLLSTLYRFHPIASLSLSPLSLWVSVLVVIGK